MIQPSFLDGTCFYVTTSLYSAWDKQFYLISSGKETAWLPPSLLLSLSEGLGFWKTSALLADLLPPQEALFPPPTLT